MFGRIMATPTECLQQQHIRAAEPIVMVESFFEQPILNSPYAYPARHWELDRSRHGEHRRDQISVRFCRRGCGAGCRVAELRFLASLAANRADGLFFAGDLGQRIFQQPFSRRSLGIDVRGRCFTLRINHRTSHQMRAQADRLLPPALADVDGNAKDRRGTISVFNGAAPTIETFDDPEQEAEAIARWISGRIEQGVEPHQIGCLFARRASFAERATSSNKLVFRRSNSPRSRSHPASSRSARCTEQSARR
jgi:hypothetical protein